MPCRDHGKKPARFSRRLFPWSLGGLLIHRGKDSPRPLRSLTLRIPAKISQAFSVVPGGTSYSSGKGFPEAPSVADAPNTCESLAGFFRGPWGTSHSSGKGFPEAPSVADAPDTCENLSQAFSVVPGGLLIHRGKDAGLRYLFLSDFNAEAKVRPIAPSLPGRSSSREEHRGSARCCLR